METGKQTPCATAHHEDINAGEGFSREGPEIKGTASSLPPSNSPEEVKRGKRVLKKIDLIVLPLLFFTFAIQYVDKVILNGAAQFGIVEDLNLYVLKGLDPTTGEPILDLHRFSIATLMFYWGCLVGLLPASFLAQKLPIAKFLGGTVIVWGGMVMLTAVIQGYKSLYVLRFFLGVAECAVAPGFSIIISMWWKKQEQVLRYCLWYTSTGFGGLLGSLLLYGIGHINGTLRPWKYQYLILGSITVVWGIVLILALPDNPSSAWFFTQEESKISVERMRAEQTGIENKTFKLYQVKEALLDPKTWIMFAIVFTVTFVNGAVSGFGSVIIRGFGYSPLTSILLTGAIGACVFITLVAVGLTGTLVKNSRTYLLAACELPVILGSALVWKVNWVDNRAAAISGFIVLGTFAAAYTMLLTLSSANTAGHTKKSFTAGLLWCSWAISNGVAPLTVKTQESRAQYPSCFKATIATAAIATVASLILRAYLRHQNTSRDAQYGKVVMREALSVGFDDQTDMENMLFRYTL